MSFRVKVILVVCALVFSVCSLTSVITTRYLYRRQRQSAIEEGDRAVSLANDVIRGKLDSILLSTAKLVLEESVGNAIDGMLSGKGQMGALEMDGLHQQLFIFTTNHDLLEGVFLLGDDGRFYGTFDVAWGKDLLEMFPEGLFTAREMTLLPLRENLLAQRGKVIPVVFPLSRNWEGQLVYADEDDPVKVRIVLLLDAEKLRTQLDAFANGGVDKIALCVADGSVMDTGGEAFPALGDPAVRACVSGADAPARHTVEVPGDEAYLFVRPTRIAGLRIVSVTMKSTLNRALRPVRAFSLYVHAAGLAVAVFLSWALGNVLIRPLHTLMGIVSRINARAYDQKTAFHYKDEIGVLGGQINDMYDTIQRQIARIQEEERKKTQAQISLFSDQVTPHFLYNILERIHFLVLRGEAQVSAKMLEELGKYLRITLNLGRETLPLEKEAEHARLYFELMGEYRRMPVRFSISLPDELKPEPVLKLLLQPLIENSLRHGLDADAQLQTGELPCIWVECEADGDELCLRVIDNGRGFDPKAISALMRGDPMKNQHFGLKNMSLRLRNFYGERAVVRVSSIPWMRSIIEIRVPRLTLDDSAAN